MKKISLTRSKIFVAMDVTAILCLSALLCFVRFYFLRRIGIAFVDLWNSLKLWASISFDRLLSAFGKNMNAYPSILEPFPANLYEDAGIRFQEVYGKTVKFGGLLYDSQNLAGWSDWIINWLCEFNYYLMTFLPLIILLPMVLENLIFSNNDHPAGYEGFAVRAIKTVGKKVVVPVLHFVSDWLKDLGTSSRRIFKVVIVLLALGNLNVLGMLVSVLAFYFAFLSLLILEPSLLFSKSVLTVFAKLSMDGIMMFSSAPWWFWMILVFWAMDSFRKAKGLDLLRHMESKNCGFVQELPLITLLYGKPGFGKTTTMVDIAMTQQHIFRQKAMDILYKFDLMFPGFPVQKLEASFVKEIEAGNVHILPDVDKWIQHLQESGENFGYDLTLYREVYSDELKAQRLYDGLRTYCKAFVIYITDEYLVSNLPVRTDDVEKNPYGCFPLWDTDFFERDVFESDKHSKFGHILDSDILRLGKQVAENNPYKGSFGYGIYVNTEWGKGRGNKLTLEGVDKNAEEANQKNDLYAYSLKMCRHAQTMVDNHPFFCFLSDEQRPQSLPQDIRDLCDVLTIADCGSKDLALPFSVFLDMIYDLIYKRFQKFYYKARNYRKDNFLLLFLLRSAVGRYMRHYNRLYNQFGFQELMLQKESGTVYASGGAETGEAELHPFYRMVKKIYSERFMTDCYSEFFRKAQEESGKGLRDYPSYGGLSMTSDEMLSQHDYFAMDLFKMFDTEIAESSVEGSPANLKKEREDIPVDWI